MLYPYIREAGFVWMLPLVFLSFCTMAFCLERIWFWCVYYYHAQDRQSLVAKILESPTQRRTILELCNESCDAVVLTLREFIAQYENVNLAIAERKTRFFAEAKVQESRKFLDLLAVIANISGTLGLMGTVVGISLVFKSLAQEDTKNVAMALSTAVYTTIAGIILFLLAYLPYFFFQKMTDHLDNVLDEHVHRLKDLLEINEKSCMIFPAQPAAEKVLPLVFSDHDTHMENESYPAPDTMATQEVDPDTDETSVVLEITDEQR